MSKILGLFPGQGSQKVGMGRELFEKSEFAREMFEDADRELGFELSSICFSGPETRLTATEIAQPAILTMSVICCELYRQNLKIDLCAAAGHSLGEYSALVAAQALKFTDAVQLVHKRGRYMQEAVPLGKGKMIAVLGKELTELENALGEVNAGIAEIANINAPGQIVLSGDLAGIDQLISILTSEKFGNPKVIPLAVSAPFHCSLMKSAADALRRDLSATEISHAKFPIYANYSASAVTQPADIRQSLEKQVCGRVRWVECLQNAIKELQPTKAIEFGLGNTLSGMLKRIYAELPRATMGTFAELSQVA